ncbi:MAG: LmeA family phospholipid-binding protein, partial [Actinomycetota bacterium]
MRKLLVAAVVLVLLGAGADFVAARIFEGRVTEALQQEYDLGRRPVVQVRDVPFLPHLATGRFSTIDLAATDATARGINAAQLQLTLHGVRVPRDVMLGEPGRITVDRADGTIELSEAEVNRLLADRLQGGRLAIGQDEVQVRTQLQVLGQPLHLLVTGRLGARDGGVTFTPDEIRLGEQGRLDPSQKDLLSDQFT